MRNQVVSYNNYDCSRAFNWPWRGNEDFKCCEGVSSHEACGAGSISCVAGQLKPQTYGLDRMVTVNTVKYCRSRNICVQIFLCN